MAKAITSSASTKMVPNSCVISLANLPEDLRRLAGKIRHNRRFMTLEENEREYIEWILKQVDENKTRAAEILGIDRVSLWRKLKRYNLE
ncbi:MAG: helix-turn-helix domain-containing protein [Desulfatirhabdiaceae bacterium]